MRNVCRNCKSDRHRECCSRCGRLVPSRWRDTGFCSARCAKIQHLVDEVSCEAGRATKDYTTRGKFRGECGHAHRTIHTALMCIMYDRKESGGSDREVVRIDGAPLSDDERWELEEEKRELAEILAFEDST